MTALYLFLLTTTATLLLQSSHGNHCKRRVCYFHNMANRRHSPDHRFFPEDIDPSLCSHIVFYGASLSGNTIVASQEKDESTDLFVGNYEKVIKLKKGSVQLLVLLSLHVNYCEDDPFLKNNSRGEFVSKVIKFLRKHHFDGLVLHCDYYGNVEYKPSAKNVLSEVVSDLRQAFNEEAAGSNRLLLVLGAVGEKAVNDNTYNIQELSRNVDWINLMAVFLHAAWRGTTGHHSPLYSNVDNEGAHLNMSVDVVVQHWISHGAPRDTLVLGLPSFGSGFELTSSNKGIGAPSRMYVEQSTGEFGIHAYFDICKRKANISEEPIYNDKEKVCQMKVDNETDVNYILNQRAPYLVSGNKWIGYDDVISLWLKTRYLKEQGLGGFAFYSLDYDDFRGWFCGQGRYPLLKTVNLECLR